MTEIRTVRDNEPWPGFWDAVFELEQQVNVVLSRHIVDRGTDEGEDRAHKECKAVLARLLGENVVIPMTEKFELRISKHQVATAAKN